MAAAQNDSLVSDVLNVKNAVVQNWDFILQFQQDLKATIQQGLAGENFSGVEELETFVLPDLSNFELDQIAVFFGGVEQRFASNLDPLLAQVQNLETAFSVSEVLGLVPDTIADLPENAIATVKSLLTTLLNDGLSVSLKDLGGEKGAGVQGVEREPDVFQTLWQGLVNQLENNATFESSFSKLNASFANLSSELEQTFNSLNNKPQTGFADIPENLNTFIQSIVQNDGALNTKSLVKAMNTLIAAQVANGQFTDGLDTLFKTLQTNLPSLANDLLDPINQLFATQVSSNSELESTYNSITGGGKGPVTILDLITLLAAIPLGMGYLAVYPKPGNGTDFSVVGAAAQQSNLIVENPKFFVALIKVVKAVFSEICLQLGQVDRILVNLTFGGEVPDGNRLPAMINATLAVNLFENLSVPIINAIEKPTNSGALALYCMTCFSNLLACTASVVGLSGAYSKVRVQQQKQVVSYASGEELEKAEKLLAELKDEVKFATSSSFYLQIGRAVYEVLYLMVGAMEWSSIPVKQQTSTSLNLAFLNDLLGSLGRLVYLVGDNMNYKLRKFNLSRSGNQGFWESGYCYSEPTKMGSPTNQNSKYALYGCHSIGSVIKITNGGTILLALTKA